MDYYVDENKILRNLPNKKELKEGDMLCLIGLGIKIYLNIYFMIGFL